jgi:hypothetical protein
MSVALALLLGHFAAAAEPAEPPALPVVQTLANAEVVGGLALPAGTELRWLPELDQLLRVTPPRDVVLWGLPLRGGSELRFDVGGGDEAGLLRAGTLAADAEVGGVRLREGSEVIFACADLGCADDPSSVAALRGGTLAKAAKLDGRRWGEGTYVVLGPDGALQSAQLPQGQSARIDGVKLSSMKGITFFAGGALRSGTLAADARLGGVKALGGREVEWGEDGAVERLTLARDAEISGHALPAGAVIGLYPSGALGFARTLEPGVIAGLPVGPRTAGIEFFESGRPASIVTEEDFSWDGVRIDGELGYRVEFDDTGRLRVARLAEPLTVGEFTAPAGAYVRVDASGAIAEVPASEVLDR